jgi:hypothetical protein
MSDNQLIVGQWLNSILQPIKNVKFNDENHYFVQHDSGVQVRVTVSNNSMFLHLYGVLCSLHSAQDSLLHKALEHNLFLENTGGATLAIDKKNNCLVLNYREEIERLNQTLFENTLLNYIQTLNELDILANDQPKVSDHSSQNMQSFLRV